MDSVPATPSGNPLKFGGYDDNIVDGALLEAAKENIQPLARGRRATALSQALQTPIKDRAIRLNEERRAMRAQLDQAVLDDDDPLDAYLKFVDWTIEAYPQGHNSDSGLISLFDEATRSLKDDSRYKNDLRYLKLWVLYAAQVEKPVDMFSFLLANEIGTLHALLYEEYALALERDGRRTEADDIYRLGVNRRVRPLERLQSRYKEFQIRMISGPAVAPPPPQPSTSVAPTKARRALGEVKSSAPLPHAPTTPSQASSNTRIQPFVDTEEGGIQEPGNEWPEFGTRIARTKENQREVTRAGDGPLKLARPPSRVPSVPIIPYVDEVPETPHTPSHTSKAGVMTPSKGTSEAELLRRDPFLYYDTPGSPKSSTTAPATEIKAKPLAPLSVNTTSTVPSTSTSASTADAEAAAKARGIILNPYPNLLPGTAGAGKRPEKHRFNLELLWQNGQESCIAEARARHMGLLGKQWPSAPVGHSTTVDFNDEGTKSSKRFMAAARSMQAEPTVTINTKAALADVYGMFNVTGHLDGQHVDAEAKPDENADSLRRSGPRVPATPAARNENAMGPPSTIRATKPFLEMRTPSHSNGPQPAMRTVSAKKILTQRALTPRGDDQRDMAAGNFIPFRDTDVDDAPQTPAADVQEFQPYVDADVEDDSVAFVPPARSTPAFQPFVDEDVDEGHYAHPTPRRDDPFLDDERGELSRPDMFKAYESEDDQNDDDGEDHCLSQSTSSKAAFQIYTGGEDDETRAFDTPTFDRAFVESQSQANGSHVDASGDDRLLLPHHRTADLSFNIVAESSQPPFRLSEGYTIASSTGTSILGRPSLQSDATRTMEFTTSVLPSGDPQLRDVPNPCNPYTDAHVRRVLGITELDKRSQTFEKPSNQLDLLRRRFANEGHLRGRKSLSADATMNLSSRVRLTLGTAEYEVSGKLGEGAFGTVFVARDCSAGADHFLESEDTEGSDMVAIKVVRPGSPWEFCVMSRLLEQLPRELHSSVIRPRAVYCYADEGFMVMNLCKQGTLLDVVNRASELRLQELGAGVDEQLVLFFVIELLRIVIAMHAAGFIHGDLKIDNCMLRIEDSPEWSATYDPSGAGGWSLRGIRLIDFGRAIDTRLYPDGQTFVCDWETDEKDCVEAQEGRAWTYQTDYFGLASVAFTLLFGKHFDGVKKTKDATGSAKYVLKHAFKRYWHPIWTRLFEVLLNPCSCRDDGSLPICDELTVIVRDMEQVLLTYKKPSSTRAPSLKSLLRKVESGFT